MRLLIQAFGDLHLLAPTLGGMDVGPRSRPGSGVTLMTLMRGFEGRRIAFDMHGGARLFGRPLSTTDSNAK